MVPIHGEPRDLCTLVGFVTRHPNQLWFRPLYNMWTQPTVVGETGPFLIVSSSVFHPWSHGHQTEVLK
jgi:hypothetical protein